MSSPSIGHSKGTASTALIQNRRVMSLSSSFSTSSAVGVSGSERHAAERAGDRFFEHDLRVHRAGPERPRPAPWLLRPPGPCRRSCRKPDRSCSQAFYRLIGAVQARHDCCCSQYERNEYPFGGNNAPEPRERFRLGSGRGPGRAEICSTLRAPSKIRILRPWPRSVCRTASTRLPCPARRMTAMRRPARAMTGISNVAASENSRTTLPKTPCASRDAPTRNASNAPNQKAAIIRCSTSRMASNQRLGVICGMPHEEV